ncbi:MarR family transcriptional regulator [Actinomadura kijaniata]|uniref:MarR family transcriptional regulator n=1 Tax=Actinomadura kijaniata TaxID=46161 RepID=UPI003F19A653
MTDYVPEPPSSEPVVLSREVLDVLAMVDLSPSAYRVLLELLAHHDPETGVARVSQNDLVSLLGSPKQTVNNAVQQLRAVGIIVRAEYRAYTLHPALTGGATPEPLMDVPMIASLNPEKFSEARRARYARQLANLTHRSA